MKEGPVIGTLSLKYAGDSIILNYRICYLCTEGCLSVI